MLATRPQQNAMARRKTGALPCTTSWLNTLSQELLANFLHPLCLSGPFQVLHRSVQSHENPEIRQQSYGSGIQAFKPDVKRVYKAINDTDRHPILNALPGLGVVVMQALRQKPLASATCQVAASCPNTWRSPFHNLVWTPSTKVLGVGFLIQNLALLGPGGDRSRGCRPHKAPRGQAEESMVAASVQFEAFRKGLGRRHNLLLLEPYVCCRAHFGVVSKRGAPQLLGNSEKVLVEVFV